MAAFHSRSNSFPSQSHPVMDDVEDHLCRLKSSESASTSTTSICSNLVSLRDLHEGLNNLIQMPSFQQARSQGEGENWVNELLEESLRLVDLCGFSRDVVCLTKESIQDLESAIRRNGGEKATRDHINAYVASRKKINKMVNKSIKNLKSLNQSSTPLPAIGTMLKENRALVILSPKVIIDSSSVMLRNLGRENWNHRAQGNIRLVLLSKFKLQTHKRVLSLMSRARKLLAENSMWAPLNINKSRKRGGIGRNNYLARGGKLQNQSIMM
ncbi:UNVERIFIED_CONTAM: hypothetical protein Sangu_2290900 [Sesamum angustifolium]|uniref:Uncharacterized protein n=1 Tax=Sesamum angustifolium TaxID=2727405 RepID=A0AAW2L5U2_9LAMI